MRRRAHKTLTGPRTFDIEDIATKPCKTGCTAQCHPSNHNLDAPARGQGIPTDMYVACRRTRKPSRETKDDHTVTQAQKWPSKEAKTVEVVIHTNWKEVRDTSKHPKDKARRERGRVKKEKLKRKPNKLKSFDSTKGYPGEGPSMCKRGAHCTDPSHFHKKGSGKAMSGAARRTATDAKREKKGDKPGEWFKCSIGKAMECQAGRMHGHLSDEDQRKSKADKDLLAAALKDAEAMALGAADAAEEIDDEDLAPRPLFLGLDPPLLPEAESLGPTRHRCRPMPRNPLDAWGIKRACRHAESHLTLEVPQETESVDRKHARYHVRPNPPPSAPVNIENTLPESYEEVKLTALEFLQADADLPPPLELAADNSYYVDYYDEANLLPPGLLDEDLAVGGPPPPPLEVDFFAGVPPPPPVEDLTADDFITIDYPSSFDSGSSLDEDISSGECLTPLDSITPQDKSEPPDPPDPPPEVASGPTFTTAERYIYATYKETQSISLRKSFKRWVFRKINFGALTTEQTTAPEGTVSTLHSSIPWKEAKEDKVGLFGSTIMTWCKEEGFEDIVRSAGYDHFHVAPVYVELTDWLIRHKNLVSYTIIGADNKVTSNALASVLRIAGSDEGRAYLPQMYDVNIHASTVRHVFNQLIFMRLSYRSILPSVSENPSFRNRGLSVISRQQGPRTSCPQVTRK